MRPFFSADQCKRYHQFLLIFALFVFTLVCLGSGVAAQSIVGSVMTSVVPSGTNVGNVSSTVVDAKGNVFTLDDEWGVLTEIPANGGSPVVIQGVTQQNWGWRGLSIDDAGNLYLHNCWGGQVFKFANVNGTYPTRSTIVDFGIIPNPQWWNNFAGLSVDPSGHTIYLVVANWNNSIFQIQFDGSGNYVGKTQIVPSLTSLPAITLDRAGNLYFQASNQLSEIPAGATSPIAIPSTFGSANGIFADARGNVFVTDGSNQTVVKIPFENGALNPANQITLLKPALSIGTSDHAQPVFVDNKGAMYLPLGGSGVLRASFDVLSAPTAAVGQVGSPASMQLYFNSAITPNFSFLADGAATTDFQVDANSQCVSAISYGAGTACRLDINFAPTRPGLHHGFLSIADASGNVVGNIFLSSVAQGAGLVVDPGTQTSLTTGFTAPSGVALDGFGNLFVADAGLNAVKMFPNGGAAVTVGTGLSAPSGVAVDGAGNLYVSDTGNNRVVLIPRIAGALSTADQVAVATGLNTPTGIAVDGQGALYVANSGAGTVLKIVKSVIANGYITSQFGGTFTTPAGIAVDGFGNVFVTDSSANSVVEFPANGGSPVTVATGLGAPTGVAVDAAGSAYIADSANQRVVMVPFVNGAFDSNGKTQMAKSLVSPRGVTIDAAGNLVIADAQAPAVVSVVRTSAQLTFGSFNVGTSSATFNASLYNIGNQPLTLSNPMYTVTGDAADFAITTTASTSCDPVNPVAPGAVCTLSAVFTPTIQGPRAAAVALQSSALNAGSIQFNLAGTGVALPSTTLTLSLVSPATGNPVYGQTPQVMATVASPSAPGTPTGTVAFTIDGHAQPDLALANGSVTISLLGMTGGSHIVTASYSGDANFAASTAGSGLTITVDKAPSSSTITIAQASYPTTNPGQFKAAVTSTVTGIPSGTVTFMEGTTALATVDLDPKSDNTAIWSPKTNPFAAGTHTVIAVYQGDTNYAPSTSAPVTITITPPPDFTMSTSASALEVTRGGSGQFTLNMSPKYGMKDNLILKCAGFADPTKTTCVFVVNSAKQPNATISGTATIQALADGTYPSVTVQVWAVGPTNASLRNAPLSRGTGALFFAFLLPGLGMVSLAGGVKLSRRGKLLGLLIATVLLVAMMSACGGSSLNPQNALNTGAATGTSTITLSVESAGLQEYAPPVAHQMTFALTVK